MATIPHTTHPLPSTVGKTGSITIRSATPADAARVLTCAREVFVTSPHVLTSPGEFTMTEEQEREFIARLESHPRQVMLIAEHEGMVIGILNLTQTVEKRKMRHRVLLGMSVLQKYRGRRVGTALMSEAIRWAESHPDLQLVTLQVYEANAAGMALYRRFGFKVAGTMPGGLIHDDGSVWDQVEMYREV